MHKGRNRGLAQNGNTIAFGRFGLVASGRGRITARQIEAARRAKVKKFVYAASASCYGKTKNIVSENTKISLEHPYALSKFLGEKAAFHLSLIHI